METSKHPGIRIKKRYEEIGFFISDRFYISNEHNLSLPFTINSYGHDAYFDIIGENESHTIIIHDHSESSMTFEQFATVIDLVLISHIKNYISIHEQRIISLNSLPITPNNSNAIMMSSKHIECLKKALTGLYSIHKPS